MSVTAVADTDAWPRARAAAERAVALDSTSAQARLVSAAVKMYFFWDWERAGEEFRRAAAINPNLALGRYHYAWYLVMLNRLDEALVEHIAAEELDPYFAAMLDRLPRLPSKY